MSNSDTLRDELAQHRRRGCLGCLIQPALALLCGSAVMYLIFILLGRGTSISEGTSIACPAGRDKAGCTPAPPAAVSGRVNRKLGSRPEVS